MSPGHSAGVVSAVLDGKDFVHAVDAVPAKGVRFLISMPEDKGIWTGTYESDFASQLAAAIRPGDIAYDIGGWHGFFTGVFAANGARETHVFEPLPQNVQRIRKLMELNPRLVIRLHETAVSATDSHTELIVMPQTSMAKLEASTFQADTK